MSSSNGTELRLRVKHLTETSAYLEALDEIEKSKPQNGMRRESLRFLLSKVKDLDPSKERDFILGRLVNVCFQIGDIEIPQHAISLIGDRGLMECLATCVQKVLASRLSRSENGIEGKFDRTN